MNKEKLLRERHQFNVYVTYTPKHSGPVKMNSASLLTMGIIMHNRLLHCTYHGKAVL